METNKKYFSRKYHFLCFGILSILLILSGNYSSGCQQPTYPNPPVIKATDGSHEDKVVISWSAVSNASYYKVYRSVACDGSPTQISGNVTDLSYTDTTVIPDTFYYYYAKTVNTDASLSALSNCDLGYADLSMDMKIQNPTPGNGTTWVYKKDTLNWKEPLASDSYDFSYDIYFGTVSGNLDMIYSGVSHTTCDPGTMELNTWYYWRVDTITDGVTISGNELKFLVPGLKEYPADGEPIGGGYGYTKLVDPINDPVETKIQLLHAFENAIAGDIIYIADDAEIDMTGEDGINIPTGIILASGRGKTPDSEGGLIFKNSYTGPTALFIAQGSVRITGLRLKGPGHNSSGTTGSRGIRANDYIEIDNCELYGWSYAAINLDDSQNIEPHIHNNYIHDCTSGGLGYGIEVGVSQPLITANIFSGSSYFRHQIAGTGEQYCSYEASYNIVLKGGYLFNGTAAHNFDMHGPVVAGSWINMHHNTFANPRSNNTSAVSSVNCPDISIRGVPLASSQIEHNWFFDTDISHAVKQNDLYGNLHIANNYMGLEQSPQETWSFFYWN